MDSFRLRGSFLLLGVSSTSWSISLSFLEVSSHSMVVEEAKTISFPVNMRREYERVCVLNKIVKGERVMCVFE